MNHLRLHIFLFSWMSLVATTVYAVDQLPEKEEDIPVEFIPTLDTTVSVGVRRLQSGPKVRFGSLGSMSQPITAESHGSGSSYVTHQYTDGYVVADQASGYEKNGTGSQLAAGEYIETGDYFSRRSADGKTISVFTSIATARDNGATSPVAITNPDGSYIPNTHMVPNPDGTFSEVNTTVMANTSTFLAYDAGRARTWAALNRKQIYKDPVTGKTYVDMHADGVTSAGSSLEAESTGSTGFDVSVERRLGKRGGWEWGVSAGFKFAFINAKATGVFPAYILRTTDTYELVDTGLNTALLANGTVDTTQPGNATDLLLTEYSRTGTGRAVLGYTGSTTAPTTATVGGNSSTATPLNVASWTQGAPTIAGVVMIHGNYQLKGAYYLMQLGPTLRYRFNDRWALSASAGGALAWVGTNYRATEFYNTWNDLPASLQPSDIGNTTEYHITESNSTHKFVTGLYYDLNAEYWMTERTGFFCGVTGQKMRKYNQNKLSGRTATVDMGNATGWRIGIMTRF